MPNNECIMKGKILIGGTRMPKSWKVELCDPGSPVITTNTVYRNYITGHKIKKIDAQCIQLLDEISDREWSSLRVYGWDIDRSIL